MSLVYRFRISEEERKDIINVLKYCIFYDYKKYSNNELREVLKLLIKMITFNRKFRGKFEKRIDEIIKKLRKGNIRGVRIIIKRMEKEFENSFDFLF